MKSYFLVYRIFLSTEFEIWKVNQTYCISHSTRLYTWCCIPCWPLRRWSHGCWMSREDQSDASHYPAIVHCIFHSQINNIFDRKKFFSTHLALVGVVRLDVSDVVFGEPAGKCQYKLSTHARDACQWPPRWPSCPRASSWARWRSWCGPQLRSSLPMFMFSCYKQNVEQILSSPAWAWGRSWRRLRILLRLWSGGTWPIRGW